MLDIWTIVSLGFHALWIVLHGYHIKRSSCKFNNCGMLADCVITPLAPAPVPTLHTLPTNQDPQALSPGC